MSNSIHSLQSASIHTQTEQSVQPPKKPQATTQAGVQDTVTVSKAAQQALANSIKAPAGGDAGGEEEE